MRPKILLPLMNSRVRHLLLLIVSTCSALCDSRFTFEKAEMGVPFRITLFAPSEDQAQKAAESAFERIAALNAVFTDYDSDSELCRLSDTSGKGIRFKPSDDLWLALTFAQKMAERSDGAFDMTVGPLVNLWRTARRQGRLPNQSKLDEALRRSGFRFVRLYQEEREVELLHPRMRLDAGGLAKGFAVEEALRVLREKGYTRAMVTGGGDMALGDAPPDSTGWRIDVPALDQSGAAAGGILVLSNRCISTSGDLYQRLEIGGRRHSHIIDPRTGQALTDHSLVTVIGLHGMETEALAKILSVLGPERGLPILEETPGSAARIQRAPEGKLEEWTSRMWPIPQ